MDKIRNFFCSTVLPLVYDDSLSYYELLSKCVKYINGVIDDVDELEAEVQAITGDAGDVMRWRGAYNGPWLTSGVNVTDFGQKSGVWLIQRPSQSYDQTNWPGARYFTNYALLMLYQVPETEESVSIKAYAVLITDSGRVYRATLSSTYSFSAWRSDSDTFKPGDSYNTTYASMDGQRYGQFKYLQLFYHLPKEIESGTNISVSLGIGGILTSVGRIAWNDSLHEVKRIEHDKFNLMIQVEMKDGSYWSVDDTPVPEWDHVTYIGGLYVTFTEPA